LATDEVSVPQTRIGMRLIDMPAARAEVEQAIERL
jgi:hypothetical protein